MNSAFDFCRANFILIMVIYHQSWNIFPSRGNYVKNILQFSDYETACSVLKLRDKNELYKAFSFVKSVSDIIPDKEEMFGIFSTNPQKVMLIPGLEVQ